MAIGILDGKLGVIGNKYLSGSGVGRNGQTGLPLYSICINGKRGVIHGEGRLEVERKASCAEIGVHKLEAVPFIKLPLAAGIALVNLGILNNVAL